MKFSTFFSNLLATPTQKKDRVVGIDIGSSAIKIVELQNRSGVVTLTTYGELQTGPYLGKKIGEVVSLPPEVALPALTDILRESATKAGNAVFAIPLAVSFITVISLLADEKEDLDPRIRVEARKYIPVPLSEVVLDWAEIDNLSMKNERGVLLAAIQNNPLQQFKVLLSKAGFTDTPTEIECFSTIRGADIASYELAAVIDFGATTTKLYITRKGLLQRMYRIPTGMNGVTKTLATDLKKTLAEAELLKKTVTQNDSDYVVVQKVFLNHFDRVFTEFSHVLTEYIDTVGRPLDRLVLAGSGGVFPDFNKQVAAGVGYPVTIATPFDMVAYPAFMEDTLKAIGPTFTTALGAALRSFI